MGTHDPRALSQSYKVQFGRKANNKKWAQANFPKKLMGLRMFQFESIVQK